VDIIFVRDLKVDAVIGVYEWERTIRQQLSFDLEMAADIGPAAASDNVADALDYSAVAARLIEFVSTSEFKLIEALAEQCAQIVLKEFGVPWLRLRVVKPGAVMAARDVGVLIERGALPVRGARRVHELVP
jgi:7,8-dihydroneopterin aldolase/epimerase/oxygenase